MRLNGEAYEVKPDNLIYDNSHEIDAANVEVTVPEGKAGTIKRGAVLDYDALTNTYCVHKENGSASAIVAECFSYAEDDTKAVASVYISGAFRRSVCITDVALNESDLENLRSKSIYLK